MRSLPFFRTVPALTLLGSLGAALMFLIGTRPLEASPAAQEAIVYMTDETPFVFDPVEIVVPAGSTVLWTTNRGPMIHTVTSDSGLFDSGLILNGQTFSVTFDTPGSYGYVCTPHVSLGMVGVVHVQ